MDFGTQRYAPFCLPPPGVGCGEGGLRLHDRYSKDKYSQHKCSQGIIMLTRQMLIRRNASNSDQFSQDKMLLRQMLSRHYAHKVLFKHYNVKVIYPPISVVDIHGHNTQLSAGAYPGGGGEGGLPPSTQTYTGRPKLKM